jgi:CHAT domain-containing protein
VRIVDLGEAEPIDAAVQAARRSLSAGNGAVPLKGLKFDDTDSQAADRWQAALAALAARIWQPLEPHLATTREVIISPDAALWLVPWAALRSGDGRQFALEKWRIRYVTSGRDIALTGGSAAERNDGAAIFADPDFDLGPQQTVANTAAILGELANPPAGSEPPFGAVPQAALAGAPGSVRTAGPLGSAPRLPGTAKEAAAIRTPLAKYAGAAPRMLLDQQALEGVLRRVKRPRVLVLSTHGYFLPDQETKPDNGRPALNNERRSVALDTGGTPIENPLLRCGLLLAGCNRRNELTAAGADDGVLTGLEIVGCDLRGTDLVVLSACETGIGEVHNGEGVAGLRQAFQLAGAHAVVASLWRVPDAETSQLMSDFFANLAAGQSKADALRNAQLSMVQASRQRGGSAPPFFWAAFTLTGN